MKTRIALATLSCLLACKPPAAPGAAREDESGAASAQTGADATAAGEEVATGAKAGQRTAETEPAATGKAPPSEATEGETALAAATAEQEAPRPSPGSKTPEEPTGEGASARGTATEEAAATAKPEDPPDEPAPPEGPAAPEAPEETAATDDPAAPEGPESAATPGDPSTPEAPESAATPGDPSTPEAPESAATPDDPAAPDKPDEPGASEAPGAEAEPGDTDAPEKPDAPGAEAEPGDTDAPEEPDAPGAATEPRAPASPPEASAPEEAADPGEPSEPAAAAPAREGDAESDGAPSGSPYPPGYGGPGATAAAKRPAPADETSAPDASEANGSSPLPRAQRDLPEDTSPAGELLAEVNAKLKDLWSRWERAEWVKNTYITHDTEVIAAQAREKVMAYTAEAIAKAAALDLEGAREETKRALRLLKVSLSLPAPTEPEARKRLAEIATRLGSIYGKGEYCDDEGCKDLGELSAIVADPDAGYAEKLEAWRGWRTISPPMRDDYATFVELGNEGAREIGFADLGELWRSSYDMPPDALEREVERLWQQVAPLYEQLHCYVRAKLVEKYGEDRVDPTGKIPAHLLGNMWAQEWGNIFPFVKPYPEASSVDVTAALKEEDFAPVEMVRLAERFFTSLGLEPLPETFWERSMFEKPRDREVVCHASAWDVSFDNDLRIKMCIKVDYEDLVTIHHELGHNYYFMYYNDLPALYQNGAHDGFHEGIGDTLALSVTPGYLKEIGVLGEGVERTDEALINLMMRTALDKIAFLPFGRMIDQWRWDVFSGKIPPEEMNAGWWALREAYQGIEAPVKRTESDFDPGAKYHIPANTPYLRYFLARILQFQFHRALCQAAGHEGPIHECSIYGSRAAGKKLKAMLELGASKPWPDALEAITGERAMDASALVDYFAPLTAWLEEENADRKCGW